MRNQKKLTTHDGGYVMLCVYSDSFDFQVGKKYITEKGSIEFIGDDGCPDINGGYSLNYQRYKYYGVEGSRVLAKFIMLKDNKGRYVKHDTRPDPYKERRNGKRDKRRFRRYVRQMTKFPMSDFERKVLGDMARYGL